MGADVRQALISAFSEEGLVLDRPALTLLVEHLVQAGLDSGEALQQGIAKLLGAVGAGTEAMVTAAVAKSILQTFSGQQKASAACVQVISAFSVPRVRYDPIRNAFYKPPGKPTLHGLAEDKLSVYMDRFLLLQQRLRRNRLFTAPVFGAGSHQQQQKHIELSSIKALSGNPGQTSFIMGSITQPEDGRYYLEDLSASIPIDLTDAVTTTGFYTDGALYSSQRSLWGTENCIVVAEGTMTHGGTFKIDVLGFPPPESRTESVKAAKGLDMFGGNAPAPDDVAAVAAWEAEHCDDRIVVMADVWLDRPDTFDKLHAVLSGFEEMEGPPSTFVLMGSFKSASGPSSNTDPAGMRTKFAALAGLLSQYPRLQAGSRFVLVPSQADGGCGGLLPRPALPAALVRELQQLCPSLVLASNPVRLRWGSQQIALLRCDLVQRLKALSLLPPAGSAGDDEFAAVCATVLQQSHLCPLPLDAQPVFWQHDRALALYPLPHALVLAGPSPMSSHQFQDCICINPGSLATGTFASYVPYTREPELCEVPNLADDV